MTYCNPPDQRRGTYPGVENSGADEARLARSRQGRQTRAETLIGRNATRAIRRPGEPRGVSPRVRRTTCCDPPK